MMDSTGPTQGLPGALINSPERKLFASRDLAQTRSLVGAVMKPHRLQVRGTGQQVNARMHHAAYGGVSLNRLKYGADVDIEPGPLDDFYLVQMPLCGHAQITSGSQQIASDVEVASVLGPCDPTVMRWSDDCDQLMVRIERRLVDRAMGALSGSLEPETVRLPLGFRWRECAPWRCLVGYLSECASQSFNVAEYRLIVANIEQLTVATLLSAQPHAPHNLATPRAARSAAVLPRHVKRVQEFLRANVAEAVTVEQMAAVAGVSLRSLYAGFRDYCGVSPMQYLRTLRLDGVRAELLGEPTCHIAAIAMRWGFAHLGRFSAEYKERFGESPSQTVRRH